MHVGLLTQPFADEELDTVVDFASGAGFKSVEIACRPGCQHLDLDEDDPRQVAGAFREAGVEISSLACYVDVTAADESERQAARDHLKKAPMLFSKDQYLLTF